MTPREERDWKALLRTPLFTGSEIIGGKRGVAIFLGVSERTAADRIAAWRRAGLLGPSTGAVLYRDERGRIGHHPGRYPVLSTMVQSSPGAPPTMVQSSANHGATRQSSYYYYV